MNKNLMKNYQFHDNVFTAPIYFDSWVDEYLLRSINNWINYDNPKSKVGRRNIILKLRPCIL